MDCSLKSCFHLTEWYWWSFTSDTKLRNPVNVLCRNFRRLHCFRAPTWDLPSTPQDLQASDEAPRVARQEQVGPLAVSKDADFSLMVFLFKELLQSHISWEYSKVSNISPTNEKLIKSKWPLADEIAVFEWFCQVWRLQDARPVVCWRRASAFGPSDSIVWTCEIETLYQHSYRLWLPYGKHSCHSHRPWLNDVKVGFSTRPRSCDHPPEQCTEGDDGHRCVIPTEKSWKKSEQVDPIGVDLPRVVSDLNSNMGVQSWCRHSLMRLRRYR